MNSRALREPQQDRSRATRQRLLTAAVECLAELGLAGTTAQLVAERAGVSRGAAQHHFPTREALVSGAIEQMSQVRAAEITDAAATLPRGARRTETVLTILFELYSGPVFRAALQLWVAAAADQQLHDQVAPLEAELGRQAHRVALELLRVDDRQPGVRETVQATLDMVRGLGLADLLTDDSRRRGRILRQWARTLDVVLPEST
jgi:AcrR family transcriptional regulator